MIELVRSPVVVFTQEAGFVRLRRTSVPMASANSYEIEDAIERFRVRVPLRERRNLGFLLDSREAPIVGDDEASASMRPVLVELMTGFARVAILVQTALGKLQATRRTRADQLFEQHQVAVFSDEAQAIAHVRGQTPTPPGTGPLSQRGR
jgi:hypothetical protein